MTAYETRTSQASTNSKQVRGKKNLVIERSLAGTLGLFVKFSTLQEYGIDKIFFLENHNVDSSQRNIIFLLRGDHAKTVQTVAGMLHTRACFVVVNASSYYGI